MTACPLLLRPRAWCAAAVAVLLLAGCGSGDKDDPAPEPLSTHPHPLQPTQAEAAALAAKAAQAALTGLRVFRDLDSLEEVSRLTRLVAPLVLAADEAGGSAEIDCGRNPLRLTPLLCTGSMSIRTNQRNLGETIPAGTFFELRFDRFQLFTPDFERLRISGNLTITYLTDFDTRAERGVLVYRSGGLSTSENGTILDPSEGPMTVNYTDTGTVVETASERFVGLVATAPGDRDGMLAGGAIQTNFGSGFVEIRYTGWVVKAGLAQPSSLANSVGAAGSGAAVAVTAAAAASATAQVTFAQGGSSEAFVVEIAGG